MNFFYLRRCMKRKANAEEKKYLGYLSIVRTFLDKSMSFSSRLIEFQIESPLWGERGWPPTLGLRESASVITKHDYTFSSRKTINMIG